MEIHNFLNSSIEHICKLGNYKFGLILKKHENEYIAEYGYNNPESLEGLVEYKLLETVLESTKIYKKGKCVYFPIDNKGVKRVGMFCSDINLENTLDYEIFQSFISMIKTLPSDVEREATDLVYTHSKGPKLNKTEYNTDYLENVLKIFTKVVDSDSDSYEKFLYAILRLSLQECREAKYGCIVICKGEEFEHLHDIENHENSLNRERLNYVVSRYFSNKGSVKIYDNVHIVKKEIDDLLDSNYEALIIKLEYNNEVKGLIVLEVEDGEISEKSIKLMSILGNLCSLYISNNSSVKLLSKFELLIDSLSKLVDAATNQDEDFLRELLRMTLEQIPEADYGSISEMDENRWRFIDAIGHDINVLKALDLKREHSIEISELCEETLESLIHMEVIDDFSKYNKVKMPDEISEAFIKATKPVKTAIFMQYLFKGLYGGNFSIEIKKDSSKDFNEQSIKILKAIGNIIFVYLGFKKYADEQKRAKKEIELWNLELEKRVIEKTRKIKNLLDNAGQGFLCFGKNLLIDEEYSIECKTIFEREIANESILDILYPKGGYERELFFKSIKMLQETKDDFRQRMLYELLPKELKINEKFLKLSYKMIEDEKLMLIITDITHEKELENKIREEQYRSKMIIHSIKNRNDIVDVIHSFKDFTNKNFNEILESEFSTKEKLKEIYRQIHTFKGIFLQLYFVNLPGVIHEFESELSKLLDKNTVDVRLIKQIFYKSKLNDAMNHDIEIIKDVFNESYRSKVFIEEEQVLFLEGLADKMEKNLLFRDNESIEEAINVLKSLRFVSFKNLLESYTEYSFKLAERLGKGIYKFAIEGDDLLVDPRIYGPFVKTLVHVFRNAIDHGIEYPDERIEFDKDELGRVWCKIENINNQFILKIGDDGKGINIDALKQKALENKIKIIDHKQMDIVKLVFEDFLTTKNSICDISGRGVGLSAVMEEVKKLGGEINIDTLEGKGTEFIFTFFTGGLNYGCK